MHTGIKKYLKSTAIISMCASHLVAGGDIAPIEPVVVKEVVNDEWKFQLSPMFVWGMSIDGESTVGPNTSPLVVDFGDAVKDLDMTFTVHFEANKGDWTLFTEYQYVLIRPTQDLSNVASMTIDFRNYIFELGGAYAFSRNENSIWEGIGGIRYTKQELKTTLNPASTTLINISESWTDGFVGLRNIYKLSNNWSLISRADIGAGGSDFVWNASIIADYRFNEWGSVFVGYKAMDYDYDNGETGLNRYGYDATQKGPLFGLNIHW